MKRVLGDFKLFYYISADEMLIYNSLTDLWRNTSVPYALGINHGDWTLPANPETADFCSVDSRGNRFLSTGDLLKVFPSFHAVLSGAAFLANTKENMPLNPVNPKFLDNFIHLWRAVSHE